MTRRAAANDPGQYLPALARAAADRGRSPKAPLSRSEALAAAPWDAGSMPAAWESAFRRAYADRLEELGSALPAKPRGRPGASQSDEERAERGIGRLALRLPQAQIDKLDRSAKRRGCSRAKLLGTLIDGLDA